MKNDKVDESDIILEQIFKKPPAKARKMVNHYSIDKTNKVHQIDLLFLPLDGGYEYCLTLVDCASRYKAGRQLKTKTSEEVTSALIWIYENDKYLETPEILMTDKGSEFTNNDFKTWCKRNKVTLDLQEKGFHLAFVENFNRELSKKLFKHQFKIELKSKKPSTVWVKHLQKEITLMNNTITRMIKMKPIDAVKLTYVAQPENKFNAGDMKKSLKVGTQVRRLLNGDEVLDVASNTINIERRRATDPNYSIDVCEIVDTYQPTPSSLILHKLKDKNGKVFPHWFTFWELLKV